MKKMTLLLAALLMTSSQAFAEDKTTTTLENCAIQEVLPGKNMTGAFVTFQHKGPTVDIVAAEIPTVTSHVELHSMEMKDNVMTMIPLTNPKLEEGTREFKKGADHVMVMSIPEDKIPKVGETHAMTFKFSNGTQATCDAIVKSVDQVMKEAKDAKMMHH